MRKIKDVLRLRHELGLGQRQIARSCSIGQATVAEYLKRATAAGIGWPLPEGWDDARLESAVFSSPAPPARTGKPLPDLAEVREQLQRHRDLTLQLLWEEYRQKHPDGYSYSYFCERYERWRRKQDVVLRQEHRPGEKLFVDWAGATIPIHHAHGGITHAPLFVSALGVSSYTYAELTPNQQMEHWLKVQMHAFEFYGGCPQLLVPDNTKTGVIKACRYEPDLNPTYQEFATHYHVAVLPARPHKPRDKAKVESAVQVVQRWIVMRLRDRKFFSIAEANQTIRELGKQSYVFGESTFLLTSLELPIVSRVSVASVEKPYLAFFLKLDMDMVRDVLHTEEVRVSASPVGTRGMVLGEATVELIAPCLRMVQLLGAPQDVPFFSNLLQREIIYRLLQGPQGDRLRSVATLADQSYRTAKAVAWLRGNFEKTLSVDELASMTGMSRSTLHHHFRGLTAMSPLQFQKQLRLHAARQKMFTGEMDAASAAFEVGYESPSQFNREYKRLFGKPPMRDVQALRAGLGS